MTKKPTHMQSDRKRSVAQHDNLTKTRRTLLTATLPALVEPPEIPAAAIPDGRQSESIWFFTRLPILFILTT